MPFSHYFSIKINAYDVVEHLRLEIKKKRISTGNHISYEVVRYKEDTSSEPEG